MSHTIEITQITPLLHQTTKDEIEEKRKTEHLIEIKETKDQDQSGMSQTDTPANQIYNEKFKILNNGSTKSCTIFKVAIMLLESNPDAYKPKLISIGPYHKNNPQLLPMEKYKLMYLQRFLGRKDGIDVESCIHEALKCYDDIDNGNVNVGKFSEMLLLDGCSVVEYIRELCNMVPEGEGVIMHTECTRSQVSCDLLLLENQLPFFILVKLYEMTMTDDNIPFTKLVEWTFYSCAIPMRNPAIYDLEMERNIKHLLQAVHYMSCHTMKRNMPKADDQDNQTWNGKMPNATELYEAGVRFSKVGNNDGDTASLLDIKFENGLIEIPYFEVFDYTEAILRNLIAYEQQSHDKRNHEERARRGQ